MQTGSSSKKSTPAHNSTTSYMPLQKKAAFSFDATDKKQRRWGCCRISVALISLVFFVAFVVTVVYVVLFMDLFSHLTGAQATVQNSTEDLLRVNASLTDTEPFSTTGSPARDLNILVLMVDTRDNIIENGSYKATQESWRKTEATWRDLYERKLATDRLTVMSCQTCKLVGEKCEDNFPTVFYTVNHFKGDTHSYNTVVFVALPTSPEKILALLKRHARTDALGAICQKGTWSSTGCDFKVANGQDINEKRAVYNFAIQVPATTELELLQFGKTIIMQKDIDTFKVLINQPMAVR